MLDGVSAVTALSGIRLGSVATMKSLVVAGVPESIDVYLLTPVGLRPVRHQRISGGFRLETDTLDSDANTGTGRTPLVTLTSGGSPAARQIRSAAGRQPEPLRSWLLQIGGGSAVLTAGSARAVLGDKLEQDVGSQCRNLISGSYPFVANSREDVTVEDFGRVFGYGGIFDSFFEENLAPLVDRSGSSFATTFAQDASSDTSRRHVSKIASPRPA